MPDSSLENFHELRQALPDNKFIEFDLDPANVYRVGTVPRLAAAWTARDNHRDVTWLTVHTANTSPNALHACVELVDQLFAQESQPIGGITVPRGFTQELPVHRRPLEPSNWDWWYTDVPAVYDGPKFPIVTLDAVDPRLTSLLDLASPSAPVKPGDPRCLIWLGIEEQTDDVADTGGLIAMLTALYRGSGAAHFNDVATHPARRSRGLAQALCASATAQLLRDGYPAVTLGMYAENHAARRVYQALGFVHAESFTSGTL